MNRSIGLGITIVFFLLIDLYFFQALKGAIRSFSVDNQRWIKIIYWVVPVVSLVAILGTFVFFPGYLSAKARTFVGTAVFLVYISKVIGSIFLLVGDIVNGIRWAGKKAMDPEGTKNVTITRSDFIAKTALAVGGTQLGLLAYGIISGAYDYRVRKVKLLLKNLPKQFEGMTIAQLSDIHSGSFYNKTAVQGGVDMLLAQKPDVVFFTGDLVNNESKELNDYFDIFKKVKAPLGVFSTLGNHDYGDYIQWDSPELKQKNLETLIQGHKMMGWDILMNENRSIKLGGEELGIIGIENWGLGGFKKNGDLKKALENTDHFTNKLLLSHDPSHWREQVLGKTNIDAAFAGHTHGMQFGVEIGDFKWSPVQYRYKEWAGLYKENEQQLYVNRGYGFLGYPGRVGILPEITIFELQRA
ncbi:metallophosphoesterase [Lacihabitans sp. LS3-19]|uniref:metallophosphoesterase n=1 Tax=Lacihabitans sp. LS3-19 TaxID=2487335 RepID=UPI0020CC3FA1|nr:metallophosphoesterase [Lacihabitans sp. LS3-19]MCP9769569.1 metallophosphoesterase [Lacihabitans sp. LS3-19]